jgi:hypothetical protein
MSGVQGLLVAPQKLSNFSTRFSRWNINNRVRYVNKAVV